MLKLKLTLLDYNNTLLSEPTNGCYGRTIKNAGKEMFTNKQLSELFLRDRMEDVLYNIRPLLEIKEIVILDRYYFSNIAYQGRHSICEIRYLNELFAPKPDIVFLFDLDEGLALQRIKDSKRKIDNYFEEITNLKKVREVYNTLEDDFIVKIDANRSKEAIHIQIMGMVNELIKERIEVDENII